MQLGSVLKLEDVDDVERLCRSLMRDLGDELQWWEIEDDIADLIGEVWLLHDKWNRGQTPSFRQYVTWRLREHKIPDLARKYRGRSVWRFSGHTHERQRPRPLSLEFPIGDGELRLGDVVAATPGRGQADRGSDVLEELDHERHSHRARDKQVLRQWMLEKIAA